MRDTGLKSEGGDTLVTGRSSSLCGRERGI